MNIEEAIPRLVAAYDAGLLVPFIGAGMSSPLIPGWQGFIAGLEKAARIGEAALGQKKNKATGGAPPSDPADLIRRANRAVRVLKRRDAATFPDAVRGALYPGGALHEESATAQTRALAAMWWPLVLTTNYDDVFAREYARAHDRQRDQLSIYGRSPQDCQSVLSSLTAPTACLLWALQGYLPRRRSPEPTVADLEGELIVGHEEYRRVNHAAPHFRRAFAEVFRRRSLLFLGSGLSETYLLELFSEILETYGANPHPHYAMVLAGTVDVDFLKSRMNTVVIEYEDHAELPDWLKRVEAAWEAPRARQMRWGYSLTCGRVYRPPTADDLEIVRGEIPRPADDECVAVSAGRHGDGLAFGQPISDYLEEARRDGLIDGPVKRPTPHLSLVNPFRVGKNAGPHGAAFAAVVARNADEVKDLRTIGPAVAAALDWAADRGSARLHMQLLAAGRTAHFPARYSLTETVRAFAEWRDAHPDRQLRLSIHVRDLGVLFELATGRVDPLEILTCGSDRNVRIWVEVSDGVRLLEREMVFVPDSVSIGELARRFDIPEVGWAVDVTPPPQRKSRGMLLQGCLGEEIRSLGVLAGSTLRFRTELRR